MLDSNLLDGFELVEIKTTRNPRGLVTISADKARLGISNKFTRELGWEDGKRVNLRRKGRMFALVPDKVGLLKIHTFSKGGAFITSKNLCLEIMSQTESCREFEGWVEDDVLFFRPKRGEE